MHSVILLQYAIKLDLFSLLAYNYHYSIYIRHTKGYKMFVLSIIALLSVFLLFLYIIIKVNQITYKKYKYEFINAEVLVYFVLTFTLLYLGKIHYFKAVLNDGDIWNGILLFAIGVIIFIIRLIINIKIAGFFKGILFTIYQIIIYLPLSFVFFIMILILMFIASKTKLVYNLN